MMRSSAGTGKQMIVRKSIFLEIIICFPIFREKAISWKGETDILGEQPRRLLLNNTMSNSEASLMSFYLRKFDGDFQFGRKRIFVTFVARYHKLQILQQILVKIFPNTMTDIVLFA